MPTSESSSENIRLVWHRRDLRLLDNPLYSDLHTTTTSNSTRSASSQYDTSDTPSSVSCSPTPKLLSLYVFDESYFRPRPSTCSPTKWDAVNTGPHAARLLIEAVTELRDSIRSIGGELLVRVGDPAIVVPRVARAIGANEIWWSEEPGTYEWQLSRSLKDHFGGLASGVRLVTRVGCTLYHPDDIPRGGEEWARLAHPNQKQNRRKNKHKNKKDYYLAAQHTVPSDKITATKTATTIYDTKESGNSKHNNNNNDFVDLSTERFEGMSKIMGDFRKAARASTTPRHSLPPPLALSKPTIDPTKIEPGTIPTLEQLLAPLREHNHRHQRPILGIPPQTINSIISSAISHQTHHHPPPTSPTITRGGEKQALARLHHFIHNGHAATADRALADVSGNNSSKLAAHLALGTLSPRTVHECAARAEGGITCCTWLMHHVEMRDFFLYLAFQVGDRLFRRRGLPLGRRKKGRSGEEVTWYDPAGSVTSEDGGGKVRERWVGWATGGTGLPLVDAAMAELLATGYCSNRVRQNVASVLCKDLGIDWRAGAEWFQFLLEDYCVGANWGNWLYLSGVGPDPKRRHFRTVSQALRYDPDGSYVMRWVPSLGGRGMADGGKEGLFRPWDYIADWKEVIVDPITQLTWQDSQRLQLTRKLFTTDVDDAQENHQTEECHDNLSI